VGTVASPLGRSFARVPGEVVGVGVVVDPPEPMPPEPPSPNAAAGAIAAAAHTAAVAANARPDLRVGTLIPFSFAGLRG
jgi:hypothetical protein